MRQTDQQRFLGIVAVLALFGVQAAHAAPITWGTPTMISGDTDVQTGTIVDAYYMGGLGAPTVTVNGVTFSSFGNTGNPVTVGNVTVSSTTAPVIANHLGIFGSASAPFASLSSAYQALLVSDENTAAVLTGGPAYELTVTIGGLTSGNSYDLEFWVNDSRLGASRIETITSGPNVSFNTASGAEGAVGQYVIGSFTADGSGTQAFTVTGTPGSFVSQINALEVFQPSSVPEPTTFLMAGLGLPLLWFVARRRRRKVSSAGKTD